MSFPKVTRSKRTAAITVAAAVVGVGLVAPIGTTAINATATGGSNWTGVEGEGILPRPKGMPAPRQFGTPAGAMVRSPSWIGAQRLNAGWAYSSGSAHRAWDVGLSLRTKVFAPRSGIVIGTNDGVANNPYGYNPGSGANSNWVLLCHNVNGVKFSTYWQHLSPGVVVKVGQKVLGPAYDHNGALMPGTGTLLGYSGNTGNSTGPHLHLATFVGCAPATRSGNDTPAAYSRYNYLTYPSRLIWEPTRSWVRPVIDSAAFTKAVLTMQDSPYAPLFRSLAGYPSSSTKTDASFRFAIRVLHARLQLPVQGIPYPVFLRRLANDSQAYTLKG